MGLRKWLIDKLGPKEGWHIVAARYANERDVARLQLADVQRAAKKCAYGDWRSASAFEYLMAEIRKALHLNIECEPIVQKESSDGTR